MVGGMVNYVFRGTLIEPLSIDQNSTPINTVIIKHASTALAGNEAFQVDQTRCDFEAFMLGALNNFPSSLHTVRAPHLYYFNHETKIQIMEDVPRSENVNEIAESSAAHQILVESSAVPIARNLGSWLRSFHSWASEPEQSTLHQKIRQNEPMRKHKHAITYEMFINVLDHFPEAVEGEGVKEILRQVRDMAAHQFVTQPTEATSLQDWGIIHGDFWMGNVIVQDIASSSAREEPEQECKLFVIDWEMAQIGSFAYDLGQMIGDIYERKLFHSVRSASAAVEGFIEGYGPLAEETAFRTAIHVGVHLLGWYTRRAPTSPLKGTPEQIKETVNLGRDLIVKGWQKDRVWMKTSILAAMFR